MATVTSLGTGSGIDLEGMITKLMTVEQQPLTALQKKTTSYQSRISSLGTLKNALATLQSAAAAMTTSTGQTPISKFATYSASVADSTIASAATSTTATAGTYSLSNIVLATSQQISKSWSGLSVPASAGTLSIQVGSGAAVDVAISAGSSLANVATAINSSNAGISASIINDGTSDHLFLTAKETGAANTIAITGSGTGWTNSPFDRTAGGSTDSNGGWAATNASDATLNVNSIAITSASNTLTTAISGVTLNLLKAGSTTVTVSKDTTSSLQSALNAFVTAYNSANTTMASLGSYNATTKIAGALQGDAILRTAQGQVRSLLFNTPAGGTSAYQLLSDIGVSVAKDGSLSLDSAKLSKAITADYSGVTSLVTKIGDTYNTVLDNITGTTGTLVSATKNSTSMITSITKQQTALSTRLTRIEANYRKQFTALDTMLASMKNTSTYLTQQLASIASNSGSSS